MPSVAIPRKALVARTASDTWEVAAILKQILGILGVVVAHGPIPVASGAEEEEDTTDIHEAQQVAVGSTKHNQWRAAEQDEGRDVMQSAPGDSSWSRGFQREPRAADEVQAGAQVHVERAAVQVETGQQAEYDAGQAAVASTT